MLGLEGYHLVPNIYGSTAYKMVDIRSNKTFAQLADEVRSHGRARLYYDRLYTLYQAVENVAHTQEGTLRIMEIGVYKGGGSYFLAAAARQFSKGSVEQYAVDTFEGHSIRDLPKGKDGVHEASYFDDTSYEEVSKYLSNFDFVRTIQGRIQEVAAEVGSQPFNLIHLDVDIYEPTLFVLNTYGKYMPRFSVIVVDDYGFKTCPGVRKAVDEFVAEHPGLFAKFELLTGQCLLVRQ